MSNEFKGFCTFIGIVVTAFVLLFLSIEYIRSSKKNAREAGFKPIVIENGDRLTLIYRVDEDLCVDYKDRVVPIDKAIDQINKTYPSMKIVNTKINSDEHGSPTIVTFDLEK